jgi:GDPmannose 4,6-dehydratase
LHFGDLTDPTNLIRLIQKIQPDEIYIRAGQTHVQASFEAPEYSANADKLGALRLLEEIRILGINDRIRFYQASTSQMYGISFNHDSPIRGETFVSRKISRAVAAISLGLQEKLYVGNLDAKRDWGPARDYAEGIWRILQQDAPDDYVLATGGSHSVREFIELAFAEAGMSVEWKGSGLDEIGVEAKSGNRLVQVKSRRD